MTNMNSTSVSIDDTDAYRRNLVKRIRRQKAKLLSMELELAFIDYMEAIEKYSSQHHPSTKEDEAK